MERKKRRKRKRFCRRLLVSAAVLAGVLAVAGIAAAAAWRILDYQGKRSLAQKQAALPEQMEKEPQPALQAGALRYQGETYVYKEEILTFLFLGIDRAGEAVAADDPFSGGQADALFLAVLDPQEETISVIGINRDTMAEISVYDSGGLYAGKETAQIALAHAYGDGMEKSCENTVEAVSQLFYGLPIHGYCALNMEAVTVVNDAVGGVDVIIPESAANADMGIGESRYQTGWKAGEQVHLMGNDAYTFLRYRDTEQAESAGDRLERQKQYLKALIARAKEAIREDLTLPFTLFGAVTPYMVTDLSLQEAVYLAGQAAGYRFSEENLYTIPGQVQMGEIFEEFYCDDTALYELILQIFYETAGSETS